jgi:hypothetical protein
MVELLKDLIVFAPGMLLGWAAIRRAEALVIWARRRSPRVDRRELGK